MHDGRIINKRIKYIDTIKFGAILIVCVTHYIAIFNQELFYLWREFPTSLILKGVSGKLGVCILGVIMCYLASSSKEPNPVRYIIKRYFYFVFAGLILNFLYIITGLSSHTFGYAAIESLKLGSEIFPTFWCMCPFWVASVISYLNGKYCAHSVWIILLEILLLALVGWGWVSICLLGNVACVLLDYRMVSNWFDSCYIKFFICFLAFWAIKREESVITYLIDGLSAASFIMVVKKSKFLQTALELPFLERLGYYTMSIFLLHNLVFFTFGRWMFSLHFFDEAHGIDCFVIFIVCMFIVLLFSIVLQWCLNMLNNIVDNALELIINN